MIRRPPRSTLSSSSAASDVYKRQAHVLVVERMGHEAGDAREAPVGERELAHAVSSLGGDHLREDRLFLLRAGLGHPALGKGQANALDEVAVAVEGLVEADPALGAA